jgi:hypothetical protein
MDVKGENHGVFEGTEVSNLYYLAATQLINAGKCLI